jgi:hypothetical protein
VTVSADLNSKPMVKRAVATIEVSRRERKRPKQRLEAC